MAYGSSAAVHSERVPAARALMPPGRFRLSVAAGMYTPWTRSAVARDHQPHPCTAGVIVEAGARGFFVVDAEPDGHCGLKAP